MAKKKGRASGKNQFILGALVGAAAAYFILSQRGPAGAQPVRPLPPGTIPMLPADTASLGDLPKYMFRPRTKLYL